MLNTIDVLDSLKSHKIEFIKSEINFLKNQNLNLEEIYQKFDEIFKDNPQENFR